MASACVLVVEDEIDLVATYERLLRRHGYRVVSARSREAGLAALKEERPHLLIADLRLPDGDGLDVVRAARALPTPTPVIVVSGFASNDSRAAALHAHNVVYEAQPKAKTTVRTAQPLALIVRFENARQLFWRDAGARIADAHVHLNICRLQR